MVSPCWCRQTPAEFHLSVNHNDKTMNQTSQGALASPVKKAKPVYPVQIRLPKSGEKDFYFGFSRSYWNELILPRPSNGFNPPVKSRLIKIHPRDKRGVRAIDFVSALSWIEAHTVQEPAKKQEAA